MKDARTDFWLKATNDWFSNGSYRSKMLSFSQRKKEDYDEVLKDLYACADICNFFAFVYRVFKYNDEALEEAAQEFYFHWWRSFLLSFALLSKQKYDELHKNDVNYPQVPFDRVLSDILKLEQAVCRSNFLPDKHIYYQDKGISEQDQELFPGLIEHNQDRVQKS